MALIEKTHTRDLISQSLWDKLRILGGPFNSQTEQRAPDRHQALWPYATVSVAATPERTAGIIVGEELEVGYSPAVPKDMIVQMVRTWAPTFEGETPPKAFSLWMYVFCDEAMITNEKLTISLYL